MPSLLALVLFIIIPFLVTLVLSLLDYSPVLPNRTGEFVGLHNYTSAFGNNDFINSLSVTAKFLVICVTIQVIIGSVVAHWLNYNKQYAKFLLPVLLIPPAIPPITVALIWKLLLQSNFGVIPYYLNQIFNNDELTILGDATNAFSALILIDIWQWTPIIIFIIYIGYKQLNYSAIEAAELDGASDSQIFRDITLPQLLPYIVVAVILRTLDLIKDFEKVYILTGGGPGNVTELVNVYLWRINFRFWETGIGSAMSILIYILTLLLLVMAFSKIKKILRWD